MRKLQVLSIDLQCQWRPVKDIACHWPNLRFELTAHLNVLWNDSQLTVLYARVTVTSLNLIAIWKCYLSSLQFLWSYPTQFSSQNRRNDDQKLEQHHFLFFTTDRLPAPKFEFRKFRKRVFVFDKQDISSAGLNTVNAKDSLNHESSLLPYIFTI